MTQADVRKKEAEERRQAELPAKLAALRGRVAEGMRRWQQSALAVALSLHRAPTPEQQAERFPPFPPSAPKWVQEHAAHLRELAERDAQVVWPAFDEPQPLPPVREGRRNGWSFHVGDVARVFPTSVGAVVWSELVGVDRGGRTVLVREHDRSGTVPQYATRLDALRAAHYALCRQKSAILYRSLLRCEEAARGEKP